MYVKQNNSPCRLCGSFNFEFCFECREWKLFRCLFCGYVQIANKPTPEILNEIYDTCYFASDKYKDTNILEKENKRRLQILKHFLPSSDILVLDAGCATGDFLHHAKSSYNMHGCDISAFAVALAIKKNPDLSDNIFITDLDSCAPQSYQYDAICLWDVIEHLWDPVAVCNAFAAMLKPGGFIFVSTPDIGSITARIMGKHWAFMTPPEHMGFFSNSSFTHLFGKELPFKILHRQVAGKWTNLGFLVYKFKRIFPSLVPEALSNALGKSVLKKLPIYVPTHDIQYIVARKVE